MIGKILTRTAAGWTTSTFRLYAAMLLEVASWRVAVAFALMLFISVTQGAQLLLLVPLMQLLGLRVEGGAVGWLHDLVSVAFAWVGLRPTLVTVLAALLVFSTALAVLGRWQTIFNLKLQEGFTAYLRRRLYRAIANTSWPRFSRSRSSDFVHALTIELDRTSLATSILLGLATNVMLVLIYVLLALRLSAAMTLLVFFCGLGLLLLLRGKTRAARFSGEEISQATSGMYAATTEHLGGMKTVKSYGAEERSAELFSGLAEKVSLRRLDSVRNRAEAGFWFKVGSVATLCLIVYVAFEVIEIAAAGLILLLFLYNRIIPLFSAIQQDYQTYLNVLPAFAGVMEITDRCEADAEPRAAPTGQTGLHRDILLEGVEFSYEKSGAPKIRDLSLGVEAGRTTAIVGPSGAGKSTVADLVMGLILPDQGSVLVDGEPLEAGRIKPWRRHIGYVAQDNFLFNDTVRANLLWACPGADDAEILHALSMAAAEGFVGRLPDGLDTVLGDRGVRLSGGERQRLALARALLRRPSLLILDEATSALDSENEVRIMNAIGRLRGRVTILLITHRLQAVKEADIVHVLEDGRLVESGVWDDLVVRPTGRLRTLCDAQGLEARYAGMGVTSRQGRRDPGDVPA